VKNSNKNLSYNDGKIFSYNFSYNLLYTIVDLSPLMLKCESKIFKLQLIDLPPKNVKKTIDKQVDYLIITLPLSNPSVLLPIKRIQINFRVNSR